VDRCSAAKLKATGKHVLAGHVCESKAAKSGLPVDMTCLVKASSKLETAVTKAEARGGCATMGDYAALAGAADALRVDCVEHLPAGNSPQANRCAAVKRKATGRLGRAQLKCYAKSSKRHEAVDPVCLGRAGERFARAFDKAEARGGCATIGDQGVLAGVVSAAATGFVGALAAVCGDDIVGPDEQCDGIADAACPGVCGGDCLCPTTCGNAVREGGEVCDGSDDDACPGQCLSSCVCAGDCGNGVAEAGEECDDGGNVSGDGCRDDCVLEDASALCAGVATSPATALAIELVDVFSNPVHVTAPRLDPSRLFVVEQSGVIRIVKNGVTLPTPFLDLQVEVRSGGERGLLGLAFHPDYESNGLFFVDYTREPDGATVISRFNVSADPDVAVPASEEVLFTVEQPYANHNGGQVAFGPDGRLYVGMGDGGAAGDPFDAGQSDTTLLAKLLRVDVDLDTPPFHAVPADNPDAAAGLPFGLIWAKGLRNPWRFSFDRLSGDLLIADVGQNEREEIDYQPASSSGGENYGWDDMEGSRCYEPSTGCATADRVLPIVEYDHSEGCSVTGGHVYRGCALPDLSGTYFYADYCTGFVRTFSIVAGAATALADRTAELGTSGNVSSFGEDARGEIYIANLGGEVYKIVAQPSP
jgi:cysteine-rich repeat protein